ncbi:hypothetical protein COU60_01650 [Candidatus Pacearchaeota archaeon CG10_big_fil_rev_8_21_14_0_10_34_76]|nr:MAG: hypothetical protein COU60_01650 [Candidatus Pacearchaeota archaeon CG10_big_fil_rev_8_21_14_0_10_34_76]
MESLKIVVFVPSTHSNKVRESMGNAGAGLIGNYSDCSFSSKGIGRFKPLKGATPFIGNIGELEEVEEERIEFTCTRNKAKSVIAAMKESHPYEEVAFDIYPLINEGDLK